MAVEYLIGEVEVTGEARVAKQIPHPANVPGHFYVEDGCCTMCEVPFTDAPDLFGTVQDPKGYLHCYVKRQPETADELDRMITSIRHAELECIRYRGNDRLIQLRLVEMGERGVCDNLSPDAESGDAHERR